MAKEFTQPEGTARAPGPPPAEAGQSRAATTAPVGQVPPAQAPPAQAPPQSMSLEEIQRELADVRTQLAQQRVPDVMHASALVSAQAQARQLDRVRPGGYYQIGDRFVDANNREVAAADQPGRA